MNNSRQPFSSDVLAGLRAAAERPGAGQRIMSIRLDEIEPDPEQPRRAPEHGLDGLAASIKRKGVIQPIGLRRGQGGRWIIRFGERRWRAARIAGLAEIPAFEVTADQSDYRTAAIENTHRLDFSNMDVALLVQSYTRDGVRNAEIAAELNIPEQQLKHYRALLDAPDALKPYVERGSARALYELRRLMDREGEGREAALAYLAGIGEEEITVAGVRAAAGQENRPPQERAKPVPQVQESGDGEGPVPQVQARQRPEIAPAIRRDLIRAARYIQTHPQKALAILQKLLGEDHLLT